jgi:hypothetical protein
MDIIKNLLSHFFICMGGRPLLNDDNSGCSVNVGGGCGAAVAALAQEPIPLLSIYSVAASSNSLQLLQ